MLSETELQIAEGVQANGWYVVNYVPDMAKGEGEEFFSYTVGLAKGAGWPEIIVFGLDDARSFGMLADLIEACWNNKQAPVAGMTVKGIVRDLPIKLVAFDKIAPRYFHFADWYARHIGGRAPARVQMIWPDRDGRLPDDPACDPDVRARQGLGEA